MQTKTKIRPVALEVVSCLLFTNVICNAQLEIERWPNFGYQVTMFDDFLVGEAHPRKNTHTLFHSSHALKFLDFKPSVVDTNEQRTSTRNGKRPTGARRLRFVSKRRPTPSSNEKTATVVQAWQGGGFVETLEQRSLPHLHSRFRPTYQNTSSENFMVEFLHRHWYKELTENMCLLTHCPSDDAEKYYLLQETILVSHFACLFGTLCIMSLRCASSGSLVRQKTFLNCIIFATELFKSEFRCKPFFPILSFP